MEMSGASYYFARIIISHFVVDLSIISNNFKEFQIILCTFFWCCFCFKKTLKKLSKNFAKSIDISRNAWEYIDTLNETEIKTMKTFNLGNGHTLTVEKANRGLEDDYKVTFFEDGMKLITEYYNRECLEWEYDITL